MADAAGQILRKVLTESQGELLNAWVEAQLKASTLRSDLMKDAELTQQSRELLKLMENAVAGGGLSRPEGPAWGEVQEFLAGVSRSRAQQGYSPSETATSVFSLKEPVFQRLRRELSRDAQALADETWLATTILDRLGLF